MKKYLSNIFILSLLFYCVQAKSQQKISIRGSVVDSKGTGVFAAVISLLDAKDSALIKSDLSGDAGVFEITAPSPGHFLLSYGAMGFETELSHPFELKAGGSYTFPAVILKIAPKQLQEVKLTARQALIRVRPDKTIFNVQNSITASGSNALELLQKSPGVSVDNNDNISVRGKAGVKIYIDDKMLQLAPEDLAAYLKGINSNDIEAIEMITQPGARYDASGNAGIINIRLRKNTQAGTNGNITAGIVQGVTPKANGSANINYRNKKLNIFTNATTSTGKYETDIIAPRTQKDTTYEQRLWQLSNSTNFNIKAGADYFIADRQTIGVMATGQFNKDDWMSEGITDIYYQPTGSYVKKLLATNSIPRRRTSVNTNLNYRYADTIGREINFDADHGLFRGRSKSYQPNYYIDKDNNTLSEVVTRNSTPTDIDILTARVDITLPVQKNKLGFGAKFSYVRSDNTLDFFNESGGSPTWIPDRSYNFIYKENVTAAYITYDLSLNSKWIVQSGLRAEQTNSEGVLVRGDGIIQPDNNVKRNYVDFFPNVRLRWTVDPKNNLNLSYTRRIDRPNYQSLNPFELKLDELSYVKGNSFLRPQYTNNIELTHTWKNKITTTAGYSHVKDFATQTVDTLNNYTYALAKNLATQKIAAFSINSPLTITKWWNGFVNLWFNYQVFKGKVNENNVLLKSRVYGAFTQHSFTPGKDYTVEITGWFNGPAPLGPTLLAKAFGGVDIGIQKLLLDKKATLKFTVTDIFRTAVPFRAKTDFGGLLLRFWVTRESQTARITFSYRFGNNKIKAARQRQAGLETESKRIIEN